MRHISKKKALGSKKTLTPKCNNKLAVHFSKNSDEWASPQWLVDILKPVFKFTVDPCSTDFNKTCEKHFTKLLDGIKQSWAREVAFVNPLYSEIGVWMQKAYESALNEGATVVCLVPARTDTKCVA
jgi:site-specific DNA-methyltransferase (adenine-specific)